MAINVPCSSSRRWSAKQYILAALIGTQVAVAIAVVFSIILSPAHVYFSIADAHLSQSREFYYNFTLVADNTSPHTKVQYLALNFEIWHSETGYVPAEFNTSNLQLQPKHDTTRIPVSAEYWQNNVANRSPPPAGSSNSPSPESSDPACSGCLVVVKAQVKFKIGTAFTRPYNVRVSCRSVDFFYSDVVSAPVNCTG